MGKEWEENEEARVKDGEVCAEVELVILLKTALYCFQNKLGTSKMDKPIPGAKLHFAHIEPQVAVTEEILS